MKKIQFYIALWTAKSARWAMTVLGRNATYLPGKIAVKICKDFLAQLTPPKTVIAVTGTNGKTTVSNLLTSILKENGYSVTNNSLGSNIQAGVTTALLADSTLAGKPKKDIAVLEVDERSSLLIYPYMKPDYLVCNNLMRDSIKRNAHTEFISFIINKALPENTKLILNGDDLIASGLGTDTQKRIYFGLDIEKPDMNAQPFVRDIVYCPRCGGSLRPEYIRYNHIGRFQCESCGFASPSPDYLVTAVDRENGTFTVSSNGGEETYRLLNDNIVNIYNLCSAVALLRELGLSQEEVAKGFQSVEIVKSRYDQEKIGDLTITMQSAKGQNPIACARSFDYVASCPGENKAVFLLTDDKGDSIGNSESTCWLYDCDFSYLNDPSIGQIVFSGPRCKDQYLRALLAGVAPEKMKLWPSFTGGAHMLDTDRFHDVYILYDVYLYGEAKAVKQQLMNKGASK